MKILIVDDQELVILSLEKCLVDLGYDVVSANNVSDAIKMYDEHMPNLVIADINMPFSSTSAFSNNSTESNEDTNGLEIAKYIKKTGIRLLL